MDIAMVADLHGNLPAVEALDADIRRRGIRRIFCLGDMVGKGPSSAETLDWALNNCEVLLRGNWDEGIGMKQFPRDEFYYRQLGERRMKVLRDLPLEHHTLLSGRKTRLFHGRPVMDKPLFLHDDGEALERFFAPDFEVVGYADVHRQGLRLVRWSGVMFNTGSVGNGMGLNMVQYAIVHCGDTREDPLDVTLVTLPYNNERALEDARKAEKEGLENAQAYLREIATGHYSRK